MDELRERLSEIILNQGYARVDKAHSLMLAHAIIPIVQAAEAAVLRRAAELAHVAAMASGMVSQPPFIFTATVGGPTAEDKILALITEPAGRALELREAQAALAEAEWWASVYPAGYFDRFVGLHKRLAAARERVEKAKGQ